MVSHISKGSIIIFFLRSNLPKFFQNITTNLSFISSSVFFFFVRSYRSTQSTNVCSTQ